MTKRRSIKYSIILLGVLLVAWTFGLVFFVTTIIDFTEPSITTAMKPTEAIVVLTGGSDRLSTGLELLTAGKGQKLLVSGVHPGSTLDQLLAKQAVPKDLRTCCIILGRTATDTIGNAAETTSWMRVEQFHSLRLVTAHYHMPRSLLIFREALPGIEIVPHPVSPESVKLTDWWQRPGTASLLVTEYNKYLFAALQTRLRDIL